MKTFGKFCWVAGWILKSWFFGAWLSGSGLFGAEIDRYGVDRKPAAVEKKGDRNPGALPAADSTHGREPEGQEGPSAAETPPDSRPVIVVDTLPDRLCRPCAEFHQFWATYKEAFPVRFDVREAKHPHELPEVALQNGTPLFRFQGSHGKWFLHRGWNGPEKLLAAYESVNKGFGQITASPPVAVAGGEDPLAIFKRLGGPGSFSWKPEKQVGGFVDPDTYLTYRQVNGTVKLVNGQPVVTLADPLPEVSVRKFGFWIRVRLLGVDGELPKSVVVRHTMGKLRISVQEVK